MNVVDLQNKLIAAAKSSPPGEGVPYAFEKRIMAHLRSVPVIDNWGNWAVGLWRASVPCVVLMVGLSIWSAVSPEVASPSANNDISQQIERTVLAAAEQDQSADSTW
jgi:hypothetical protein